MKQLIRDIFLYLGNPGNLFNFSPQHLKLIECGPYDTVLHIGSEIGQELSLYNFIGVKRVIWIEPIKKSLLKIKVRSIFYPRVKHVFINSLILDKSGQLTHFYEFKGSGASSIYKPALDFWDENKGRYILKTHSFTSKTIQDALKEKNVGLNGRDNLLIIDAQGAELKILKGFSQELINHFRILMCEISVNQYLTDTTPAELVSFILDLGFSEVLAPIRKTDDGIYVRF
jgi:FkbM family methyltransferase